MKSESKYIFSKGDLSRQDFSIKYKNEKGNFYLPIEKIKEILIKDEHLKLSKRFQEFVVGHIGDKFFYYNEKRISNSG